jgi:hypothetical protein
MSTTQQRSTSVKFRAANTQKVQYKGNPLRERRIGKGLCGASTKKVAVLENLLDVPLELVLILNESQTILPLTSQPQTHP